MTLMPVDPKSIPILSARHSHMKAIKVIEEFMNSGHEAVELKFEPGEYASAASVQSTYHRAIKRGRYNCVVLTRQGRTYLIKGGIFND